MNRHMIKALSLVILGTSFLILTGCPSHTGSTSNGAAAISPSFASIYTNVLSTCTQCHAPGTQVYNSGVRLDFTSSAAAYTSLTQSSVSGPTSVGTCSGIPLVSAGDPSHSYLAGVLFSDYHTDNFAGVGGCTPYATHLQDQNLSPEEEGAIVAWIKTGAQNN